MKFIHRNICRQFLTHARPRHAPAFSTANPHLLTRPVISSVFLGGGPLTLTKSFAGIQQRDGAGAAACRCIACRSAPTCQSTYVRARKFLSYRELRYRANLSINAATKKKTDQKRSKKKIEKRFKAQFLYIICV